MIFFTGFFQVFFVALNTYQIASFVKEPSVWGVIKIAIIGFAISWIWTSNVKRTAFGSKKDRIMYATGAMFGTIAGIMIGGML